MAILSLNKKEAKRILGNISDDKINDILSVFGVGVESITEEAIDVEITPNRPDMLSQQGLIRALESYFKKPGIKEYKIKSSGEKIIVDKSVEKIRPYSMAAMVKKVKFTDEKIKDIMQWQEKVHATLGRNRKKVALGYYTLDKIKFPVRYLALPPKEIIFEPLEMPEKMNGLQILQKHPTGREYAYQLEGLDKFPVYLDKDNQVLSMPPIINSNDLGKIIPGTSNILVECSGTDLDTLKKVISMAVADLIECGGEAYSIEIVYGNKKESIDMKPEVWKITPEKVNKLLGLELKDTDLKKLFGKMGLEYSNKQVLVPAYRTDMMHEVDLIEDIAIAYGYDKFEAEIPQISTIGEEDKLEILKRKIANILSGLEMLETSTLHLITKDDAKKMGIKESESIDVESSKSEYKSIRPHMMLSAIKILSENVDSEYPQKIFETGVTFKKDISKETGIKESNNLVIAITPTNFTEVKQVLEYLGRMLEKEFKLEEASQPNLIEGRTAKILFNGKQIGILGEVHPQILRNWHIKMPVAILEMNIDELA